MTSVHTHKSHPGTSFLAAESVKDTTELQERILYLFGEAQNGLIDEDLIRIYAQIFGSRYFATDASLRSRRSELHHKGELAKAKLHDEIITRKTKAGRDSTVWILEGRLF